MKILKRIPLLALAAFVVAVLLGFGYNSFADQPINWAPIPLTFQQRAKCKELGMNPNDAQLAAWGSESAKERLQAQLMNELSRRLTTR